MKLCEAPTKIGLNTLSDYFEDKVKCETSIAGL